ncbi:MAG: SDR family oxidoreductase [Alphaproteobacteria bacterium]|nr:SDR family oxidoreductase [Alphaproteobacteria bacterium]
MTPGAALVTGAGARVGRAMAEALGADGWAVCVHYHSAQSGAGETADAIRKAGGRAEILGCDLSDETARGRLVARAENLLGRPLTLLVNSASRFADDTAADHSRAGWDLHFEVNLRAPVHLAQQFAKALPPGQKGCIVNLIDQRVLKLTPQFFTYTLSKAALWQATRTLAQALAPDVRVNAIGPGPTLKSVHQTDADFAAEQAATLTGEGSSPDEIVRALRYLISATSVTGQMIASDGGLHLMWQPPDTQF